MEIFVAKHSGFCFGVKRAFETAIGVTENPETDHPIYTYGPLIHNQDVVNLLAEKGAKVIESLEDVPKGTIIIRSHGVGEAFYHEAETKGLHVVDTTCVFVKKVHRIVKEHTDLGYRVVICGDPEHPEVIGIKGWSNQKAIVVRNLEEAMALPESELPICLVAQTTLNSKTWHILKSYFESLEVPLFAFNTICSATRLRQEETTELAKKVDYMLIIGGKTSSNTQKLYEIAKKHEIIAQHIENVSEINVNLMRKYDKIGIVAGASTPDWVINEVIYKLKSEGEVVVNGRQ